MQQEITENHMLDGEGRPAGGSTSSTGLIINWQNGPLAVTRPRIVTLKDDETGEEVEVEDGEETVQLEPNGCFVETVIAAAIGRLELYNTTEFRCRENSLAITKLEEALHWCQHRTAAREARGVEGTHTP